MSQQIVKVGLSLFPPFIIKKDEKYEGFEFELWQTVAREIDVESVYREYQFKELIPSLRNGEIDVIVSSLAITKEREELIDYSRDTFDAGLRIMVLSKTRPSVVALFRSFFSEQTLQALIVLLGFIIVAANVVWIAERGGGGTLDADYFPGVFNALWWAVVSIASIGYGDYTPVTFAGRVVASLVFLAGFSLFGVYIAEISSALTVNRLRSGISGKDDLRGKKVATLEGSFAETAVRDLGADVVSVAKIDLAYRLLLAEEVSAVVFDEPVLLYYISHEGKGKVQLIGDPFHPLNYGFGLAEKSELRERVDRALLKVMETGEYNKLYKKWFGVER